MNICEIGEKYRESEQQDDFTGKAVISETIEWACRVIGPSGTIKRS